MAVAGPRLLLSDPGSFGYLRAQWPEPGSDPLARAELAAAFYIHQVVLALRRSLTERGLSQRELAAQLGVNEETLGRKIRGESWASLADVLSWAIELGIDLLPAPAGREELLRIRVDYLPALGLTVEKAIEKSALLGCRSRGGPHGRRSCRPRVGGAWSGIRRRGR